jgi:hypothetical protein
MKAHLSLSSSSDDDPIEGTEIYLEIVNASDFEPLCRGEDSKATPLSVSA